jgi:hypothetical protein
MAMAWIRRNYGVPALRGGRVKFKGKLGTIVGSSGPYLRVRLDGEKLSRVYHPTWKMEYEAADRQPGAASESEGEGRDG